MADSFYDNNNTIQEVTKNAVQYLSPLETRQPIICSTKNHRGIVINDLTALQLDHKQIGEWFHCISYVVRSTNDERPSKNCNPIISVRKNIHDSDTTGFQLYNQPTILIGSVMEQGVLHDIIIAGGESGQLFKDINTMTEKTEGRTSFNCLNPEGVVLAADQAIGIYPSLGELTKTSPLDEIAGLQLTADQDAVIISTKGMSTKNYPNSKPKIVIPATTEIEQIQGPIIEISETDTIKATASGGRLYFHYLVQGNYDISAPVKIELLESINMSGATFVEAMFIDEDRPDNTSKIEIVYNLAGANNLTEYKAKFKIKINSVIYTNNILFGPEGALHTIESRLIDLDTRLNELGFNKGQIKTRIKSTGGDTHAIICGHIARFGPIVYGFFRFEVDYYGEGKGDAETGSAYKIFDFITNDENNPTYSTDNFTVTNNFMEKYPPRENIYVLIRESDVSSQFLTISKDTGKITASNSRVKVSSKLAADNSKNNEHYYTFSYTLDEKYNANYENNND